MGFERHDSALGVLTGRFTGSSMRLALAFCLTLTCTHAVLAQEGDKAADAEKAAPADAKEKPASESKDPAAPKVKVLGLRIEGFELSAKSREDLFNVVQQRLKAYPSIELVRPPDAELTDLMIDLGCLDIDVDCLTKVGRKRMADKVFYAQVDVSGSDYLLSVRIIDVTKGHAERNRQAKVANQAALTGALEHEIVGGFGEPPPPPPAKGRLIVESDAGAKIFIDGKFVGSGRVKLKKPAGLYVVRITKPGYEDSLFRVDLEAGKTARKVAELRAVASPDPVIPKPSDPTTPVDSSDPTPTEGQAFYETWWFWTTIGVVAVSAVSVGLAVGLRDDGPQTGDMEVSVDPANAWLDASLNAGSAP